MYMYATIGSVQCGKTCSPATFDAKKVNLVCIPVSSNRDQDNENLAKIAVAAFALYVTTCLGCVLNRYFRGFLRGVLMTHTTSPTLPPRGLRFCTRWTGRLAGQLAQQRGEAPARVPAPVWSMTCSWRLAEITNIECLSFSLSRQCLRTRLQAAVNDDCLNKQLTTIQQGKWHHQAFATGEE